MNATWIPVGSAVGIILLGLGVLEVMSAGVRVDQSPPGAWAVWETHSRPAFQDTPEDLLPPELARPAGRETGYAER